MKANGREPKKGRVFNIKLGCFTVMQVVHQGVDLLHPNVVPNLRGGWQHNYSAKTKQAGCADEQSIYSRLSMTEPNTIVLENLFKN